MVVEAGLLVEGVLLLEEMIVGGVCLGLEDVIEVNRVILPLVEVDDVEDVSTVV